MVARSRDTLNSLFIMPVKDDDSSSSCSGWCSAVFSHFRGTPPEPPEITIVTTDTLLDASAAAMEEQNIDHELLQQQFHLLLDELDLSSPNKQAMLDLPDLKKWQIFTSARRNQLQLLQQQQHQQDDLLASAASSASSAALTVSPEYYIDRLNNLIPLEDPGSKLYSSLRTALRTQPHSFVHRFLSLGGLESLLLILETPSSSLQHPSVVTCIKALMNNSGGRAAVLSSSSAINVLSQSLAGEDVRSKVDVLEILGAVCLVPGGHRKVLDSITYLQSFAQERARFQTLLNDLDRSTGVWRAEMSLKTAILSFLNALLNYGPGEQSLEFRLHLRFELLMLGIEAVVEKLKLLDNDNINKHIQFFELLRAQDETQFAKNWGETHIDTKSVDEMFGIVKMRLSHSYAHTNLLSILNHLLLIPVNVGGAPPQHWSLIDRLIQQIVLQEQTSSSDSDHVVVPHINVEELVGRLGSEEERRCLESRVESLEKTCGAVKASLTSKEQELEVVLQENEDLKRGMQRARERLEKEALLRLEEGHKVNVLQDQVNALGVVLQQQQQQNSGGPQQQQNPPKSPPRRNNNKSVPTTTGGASNGGEVVPPPPPPPLQIGTSGGGGAPPPPPPPPLTSLPPPPPPLALKVKQIPVSSQPLKSFNWSKLPETKLAGTLWAELEDEAKHYRTLDLKEVDRLFSAFVLNKDNNNGGGGCNNGGGSSGANNNQQSSAVAAKAVSLIDPRRGQNCTILLSKLKMSDEELCRAILSMDVGDSCNSDNDNNGHHHPQHQQLPSDMLEQLLKYVPTVEEVLLLEEQGEDVLLARADSFLLRVSRIVHYEERLRVLHYKKRFRTVVEENTLRLRVVQEGCRELTRSKKLRKILELVLALGNYLNRGPRGNANGFKLNSLTRLQDTKSSSAAATGGNKSCSSTTLTLLHFLAGQVETSYPELVDLEGDLVNVRLAAKVSLQELEKDMGYLRAGMDLVNKEVEFQRGNPVAVVEEGDRFLPAVREFLSSAAGALNELEDLFKDVKLNFQRTVRLFGEEYGNVDDFFGVFDQFLAAFADARADNELLRRAEEDKRARSEMMTLRRTSKTGASLLPAVHPQQQQQQEETKGQGQGGSEFDDLISALRTGDVFSDSSDILLHNNRFHKSRAASSSSRLHSSSAAAAAAVSSSSSKLHQQRKHLSSSSISRERIH